jgi:hypothetical protein
MNMDNANFNKNNLSDSLLIIDMQPKFIPGNSEDFTKECLYARKFLIDNILNRSTQYIDWWKKIYLVEFSWCWDTIKEIKSPLNWKAWIIKKRTVNLTCKRNKDINDTLNMLMNNWNSVELSWVSASICVLESNFWLMSHWFITRIRIDCVLNYPWVNGSLLKYNKISKIIDDYQKYYDVKTDREIDLCHTLDLSWICPHADRDKFIWDI